MSTTSFLSLASLGASFLLFSNSAHSALAVYEGFDYTPGSGIGGQGGSVDGWGGNWSTSGTSGATLHSVGAGLSFGDLEVTGGATERSTRAGRSVAERSISAAANTALTQDNSTTWFSVLMYPTVGAAFESNTFGTLIFGDTALTDAGTASAGIIGTGGNALGVSYSGANGATPDNTNFPNITVQGVTYDNGTLTQGTADRIVVGLTTSLIVGRVDWAADGTNDTLRLYEVQDPAAALPTEFTTMTADLNQSLFNVVSLAEGQTSAFDEIRLGTELADVLPVIPEPSSLALIGLSALGFLRRRRS